MSKTDGRNLVRIALFGAVAAVLIDWYLRPAIVGK